MSEPLATGTLGARLVRGCAWSLLWWTLWLLLLPVASLDQTAHWHWEALSAHLDLRALWLPLGLGLVLAMWGRRLGVVGICVLGVVPTLGIPQAMPDTVLYSEYMLAFQDKGLFSVLGEWSSLAWGHDEGADGHHLPLVWAVLASWLALGLPHGLFLAGVACSLVWALERLGGPKAALLLLGVPLVWAHAGWVTADLSAAAAVALGLLILQRLGPLAWLPLALVKVSVPVVLAGPALARFIAPDRSAFRKGVYLAGGTVLVLAALVTRDGLRRPLTADAPAVLALALHLGPGLLLVAALAWFRGPRDRLWWGWLAALGVLLVLVRTTHPGHVARYALPVLPLLILPVARVLSASAAGALGGIGLGLWLALWRPAAFDTAAVNLLDAVTAIPPHVQVLDVWGDYDGPGPPPDPLAVLTQLSTTAQVQYRGCPTCWVRPDPRRTRSWWWTHSLPDRFWGVDPADAALVLHRGTGTWTPGDGWLEAGRWDRWPETSRLFPEAVSLFVRDPDHAPAPELGPAQGGRHSDPKAPLAIGLHPLGGTAARTCASAAAAEPSLAWLCPQGRVPSGEGWGWFPRPRGRLSPLWLDRASSLVGDAIDDRPGRPLLGTGTSQGGAVLLALIAQRPCLFERAVVFAGALPEQAVFTPQPTCAQPTFVDLVHGSADSVVPLARAEDTARRLRAAGHGVELHVLPRQGHALTDAVRTRFAAQVAEAAGRLDQGGVD